MSELSTSISVQPFSFLRTFFAQNLGAYDPTANLREDRFVKAFATANGACVVKVSATSGGVELSCDGPDSEAVFGEMVRAYSLDDGHDSFTPQDKVIAKLHQEQKGLRLLRVPWLFDVACSTVLQQRVRFWDATNDWRHIVQKYGFQTSFGLGVFPAASTLAALHTCELEALGIDAKRARALIALAREIKMNPLHANMTISQLRGRLSRIPGIGPWTVETILGFGGGDQDAVPLGDLHLPHLVCYALAGEDRGTDERNG